MPELGSSPLRDRVGIQTVPGRSILRVKSWMPRAEAGITVGGVELPIKVGTVTPCERRALCTGPGDWLLAYTSTLSRAAKEELETELIAQGLAAVDLSSGLSVIEISGAKACSVLAKGCGLDLNPRRFAYPQCARTCLAGVAVVIDATVGETFELYVARSHGSWLTDWLTDATLEFRLVEPCLG